jgi:hypothetical protein
VQGEIRIGIGVEIRRLKVRVGVRVGVTLGRLGI